MTRHHFTPADTVACIWHALELPPTSLASVHLTTNTGYLPSSFKVDHLAQSSIALSALAIATFHSLRHRSAVPQVTVPPEHACVEFKSERLYLLDNQPPPSSWGPISGLHKARDGYVRVHDNFPHHRRNALKILGLPQYATRQDAAKKILDWNAVDLETEAFNNGAVIAALRSFDEWDDHPQSRALPDTPISISKKANAAPYMPPPPLSASPKPIKCLQGIRIVELSRVIAAPVAGKTLAAHGADVLWITSPALPSLPPLDVDLTRGKRSVHLDITQPADKAALLALLRTADVFIQGYRPGSLAAKGLSTDELVAANPRLIVANLSAYGPTGPWSDRRGYDSLVQTCSGLNVAEAAAFGADEPARTLPCQALDHGAGYFLATGIAAALYKRGVDGGAYEVDVSLAGVGKYLRSLGQREGESGFAAGDFESAGEVEAYLEERETEFGVLKAVRHAARVDGVDVGWDVMPRPARNDEVGWL